ncbi:hypothetical protein PCANC_23891 [Puccinia coronata f. sp. avenae]|uniref:Lethal giant larvae (Lgl)-like C-terminal domain-containing protein n=1 Tax=Puccinia coronata f. sp. avenae TaxID=200324 RepID=A0A2N5TZ41_9BASI|nr:hypothetical protein PCANC_23891 [Puccinia coronata f. sp. avenae]
MKWQTLLQPNHPGCQPLISDDSKLCFLAGLPHSIHVYSTQSNLMVASLDIPDPAQKSRLIKILRHPISPERLLVLISSSGQIYLYDFIENSIKATYQTDLLITHAVIRNSHTPSSPAAVDRSNTSLTLLLVTKHTPSGSKKAKSKRPPPGTKDKCRERAVVFAVKLEDPSSPNQTNRPLPKIHLLKIDPVSAFSSSPCGNWLGLVTGLNIWIIRLKPTDLFNKVGDQELSKKSKFETLHLSAPEPITCIAFPTKTHADHFDSSQPESIDVSCVPCDFFATGSSSGKIALWHALSEAQWTTFAELATRTPGGGEEAVLVLWRLEDFGGMGLDSKTFLPRLGTPISSISLIERVDINEPGALVTGLDGTLMIVNTATMSVSKTLKLPKMYQLPAVYKHSTNPQAVLSPICFPESSQAHIKPYGNLLLQSSHPCGLQILDGGTGRVLSEIFVRPKNTISRRADRPIVEPKLLFAELGGIKDQYLATIDSWVDEERGFSLEITLKLWERVQQGSSDRFEVIARVDNPHDDSKISSLKLSTDLVPKIITTSIDGTIKIWTSSLISPHLITVPTAITPMTTSLPNSKKLRATSGKEFENLKSIKLKLKNYGVSKTVISKDNSIFALLHNRGCRNIISIWDLKSFSFLKSFNMNSFGSLSHHQTHKFTIRDIQFMGDKHQFIFLLGTLGCGLFDLLTGSELGFWSCIPQFMVKTPDDSKVLVIHKTTKGREEGKGKSQGETEEPKEKRTRSKVSNMLAIIDVMTKKTILNHKINHSPSWGQFVGTRANSEKKELSKKDGILDGLVLITETSGLIRGGEAVDDQTSVDQALRIEQELGISTHLPFQDLFLTNDGHHPSHLEPTQPILAHDLAQANHQELELEVDRLIEISPHLVPPSRLLWSSLIRPSKRPTLSSTKPAQPNDIPSYSQADLASHLLPPPPSLHSPRSPGFLWSSSTNSCSLNLTIIYHSNHS